MSCQKLDTFDILKTNLNQNEGCTHSLKAYHVVRKESEITDIHGNK